MNKAKPKSIQSLRLRLDEILNVAVDKIEKVMNDPRAKNAEVLNSADKLIKLNFSIQELQTKKIFDTLKIQREQLALEKQQIEMAELRLSKGEKPQDGKPQQHSRAFTPAIKPSSVNDNIIKTG